MIEFKTTESKKEWVYSSCLLGLDLLIGREITIISKLKVIIIDNMVFYSKNIE